MHSAAQAYARTARTGLTGRALEAALLQRLAGELERASAGDMVDPSAFTRALLDNRRLWAMFASDATEADSVLPEKLRMDIAACTAFVLRQTHLAMIDPRPSTVAPLMNLNRTVAEGLAAQVTNPAGPAPDAAGVARSA
jgi:flagellar protein FlaF